MVWAEELKLIVAVVGLFGGMVSIGLVYVQMRKTHEWNRRKASHDLLYQIVTGDVADFRRTLDIDFGLVLDGEHTYADAARSIDPGQQRLLDFNTRQLLNYLEVLSIGVKNNVLDEDICYDYALFFVTEYWRWAFPYVQKYRRMNDMAWCEVGDLCMKWEARDKTAQQARRIRGKPPT